MRPFIFIPYLASILFSAIMALIYRKCLGSRHLKILVPYLWYVFLQETILIYGAFLGYISSNSIVYNIYKPVNVLVFFWIYYNIPFMGRLRKLIIFTAALYFAFTLIEYCFIESIFDPSSYSSLARGFVITFYGILFLSQYFYLDNLKEERYWRPLIWITIAVVIFYPVISISTSFQKFLSDDNLKFYGLKLYQVIPQVMSIFMYGCFSYAFYLCQKKN
jgi:hypothetical protein